MSDDDDNEIGKKNDPLDEIGSKFDVTKERIRKIEEKALRVIRTKKEATRQDLYCSFCGKSQHTVERLISSDRGVYICNECIEICNDLLDNDKN